MNSPTSAFAGVESPVIGRYERSTAPAGRASDGRCSKKMVLNAFDDHGAREMSRQQLARGERRIL
jgi:hypothetical protein